MYLANSWVNDSSVDSQNKCVRYWPDTGTTKEFGNVCVRNIEEQAAQDYILRELEVTRTDQVRPFLLISQDDSFLIFSKVIHFTIKNPSGLHKDKIL